MLVEQERFEELCVGYVLHTLEAEDLQLFEQIMQEANADQLEFLREIEQVALQLPFAVDQIQPTAQVKELVLQEIRKRSVPYQAEQTAPQGFLEKLILALGVRNPAVAWGFCILVLIGSAAFNNISMNRIVQQQQTTLANTQQQLRTLSSRCDTANLLKKKEDLLVKNQNQVDFKNQRIVALRTELERRATLLKILKGRRLEVAYMKGSKVKGDNDFQAKKGHGKLVWDAERKTALLQLALPPPPKGKVYQLWTLKKQRKRKPGDLGFKPINMGVIPKNIQHNINFFKVQKLIKLKKRKRVGFAVSLEPAGGSKVPTYSKIYLLPSS